MENNENNKSLVEDNKLVIGANISIFKYNKGKLNFMYNNFFIIYINI